MVRRLMLVSLALLLAAAMSAPASAALSAGQRMAVDALIKQFSAADFDQRQKAVDRLIEIGPDVAPAVRKALADTQDNEVKLRCEMVIKGLKDKFGAAAMGEDAKTTAPAGPARPATSVARATPGERGPGKFGYDPSTVTLSVKDGDLEQALAQLAEQSGNTKVQMPRDWEGKGVTVDVKDAGYWQTLDKVAASLGYYYTYDLQNREFRMAPLKEGADVSAYAGPAVVKLGTATVTKIFRPAATVGFPGPKTGLSMTFTYFVEDRLQPLETDTEVTKIVGSDGKEIALDKPAADAAVDQPVRGRAARGQGGARGMFGGFGGFTGPNAGVVDVTAAAPGAGVDKLASVEGTVRMTFGTGKKTIQVEDALGGDNKSGAAGNAKVTVTRVQRMGGGAPVAGARAARGGMLFLTVSYKVDDKDAELPSFGRNPDYGVTLVDPNGERHRGNTGSFGGMMAFMGGRGQAPAAPAAQVDANNATMIFTNVPDVDGAWMLELTVPDQTTEKEYTFRFTDVTLR